MKTILSILVLPVLAYAAPPKEIPFWSQLTEQASRRNNFHTQVDLSSVVSPVSISEFWNANTVEKLKDEAIIALTTFHSEFEQLPNPEELDIRIEGITCRSLSWGNDEFANGRWIITVGFIALGKKQVSGAASFFTLVYIPEFGYLPPKPIEKQAYQDGAGNGR